jgi:hypothetical protein
MGSDRRRRGRALDVLSLLDPPHLVGAALDHRAKVERFVVRAHRGIARSRSEPCTAACPLASPASSCPASVLLSGAGRHHERYDTHARPAARSNVVRATLSTPHRSRAGLPVDRNAGRASVEMAATAMAVPALVDERLVDED